jgi:hypothetical protein
MSRLARMPVHCSEPIHLHHISIWEPEDEKKLKTDHIEYASNGNIIYYENHDVEIERTVMDLTGVSIKCFHWMNDPSDTLLNGVALRNERIVKTMISVGADITILNHKAFVMAVQSESIKLMNILIEHGADVHAQKDEALCIAAIKGNLEVIKILLKYDPPWNSIINAYREAVTYYQGTVSDYLREYMDKMRREP